MQESCIMTDGSERLYIPFSPSLLSLPFSLFSRPVPFLGLPPICRRTGRGLRPVLSGIPIPTLPFKSQSQFVIDWSFVSFEGTWECTGSSFPLDVDGCKRAKCSWEIRSKFRFSYLERSLHVATEPPLPPKCTGVFGRVAGVTVPIGPRRVHRSSLLGDVAARCPTSTSFDRGAWRVASRLAVPLVFLIRTPHSGDG